MIPLVTRLDDIDFDALLAIARRRLPGLAPDWTDYNHSDPGITLVELLAWVADSQVYSLARNRHDERLAMARLLGVTPAGAKPAKGIVYPLAQPTFASPIAPNSILKPLSHSAPRMETAAEVTILPVEIVRLATHLANGSVRDLTATNARQRASFVPFGDDGTGELWIEFRLTGNLDMRGRLLLSLGVELDGRAGSIVPNLGEIGVEDAKGNALPIVDDTSCALQRSGVLIISRSPGQLQQPIVIRRKSGFPLRPRIVQISPNALPVEQRATLTATTSLRAGGPGPQIGLVPASAFDKDEPVDGRTWLLADGNASFKVEVETDGSLEPWQGGRLDEAGPNDWRYSIEEQPDGSGIAVRFGNGVNGRRPGLNDAIKISAQLSTGSEGNVRKPIEWLLESQRLHLRNNFPIAGGTDAEGVADALRRASGRLRENRVLASAKQLIEALAPVLTPLEIKRADVEEGWEEGRRTPSVVATRTLLVAHERPGGESAEWLRTISRYLVARIAVGERLIVKAPKYLAFGVSVVVDPVPGSARGVVEKSVRDELNRRFIKPKDWPLGRDVDASAVSGWIRSAEGVAAVIDLRLIVGGRPCDHLPIGHGELPQFDEPADVTVREQPR